MRTFGVEEGSCWWTQPQVITLLQRRSCSRGPATASEPKTVSASGRNAQRSGAASHLIYEVQQEQLEAVSVPFSELTDLASAIRTGRGGGTAGLCPSRGRAAGRAHSGLWCRPGCQAFAAAG